MLLHERTKVKRERERESVCVCVYVRACQRGACVWLLDRERERYLRLFILNKAANDVNGVSPFHAIIKRVADKKNTKELKKNSNKKLGIRKSVVLLQGPI